MLSMISYAEERGEKKGEKKGIKKGENRLGMLMKILLDNKRYADAKRASEDEHTGNNYIKSLKSSQWFLYAGIGTGRCQLCKKYW